MCNKIQLFISSNYITSNLSIFCLIFIIKLIILNLIFILDIKINIDNLKKNSGNYNLHKNFYDNYNILIHYKYIYIVINYEIYK